MATALNDKKLKKFKDLLLAKKLALLKKARDTRGEEMKLELDEFPDEMDLASTEYLHSFTFRLRGREKTFMKKIDQALARIEDGTFGICEECEEEINAKRLEARPETTMCIKCKEAQERKEKALADK